MSTKEKKTVNIKKSLHEEVKKYAQAHGLLLSVFYEKIIIMGLDAQRERDEMNIGETR